MTDLHVDPAAAAVRWVARQPAADLVDLVLDELHADPVIDAALEHVADAAAAGGATSAADVADLIDAIASAAATTAHRRLLDGLTGVLELELLLRHDPTPPRRRRWWRRTR